MNFSMLFIRSSIRFFLVAVFGFAATVCASAQVLPIGPATTVFLQPMNISNTSGTSWFQRVALDNQGNIDVVWWDDTPGYRAVFFSRSTDGGLTFSSPQNISNDPNGSFEPQMALDSAGNIYVVWGGWSTNSAYFTSSSDGSNFSTPTKITDNVNGAVSIAVGPDGCVNLGWADASRYQSVDFNRTCDGGATFSAPALVYTLGGTPQIAVDSAGNIDVVWEGGLGTFDIWFSRSTDGGASFSPAMELAGSNEFRVSFALAVDSSNNINVAVTRSPYTDVFLERSVDGGISFTTTNVSNANSNPQYIAPALRIVVDSVGGIDVAREEPSTGSIVFNRSLDQGITFSSTTVPKGGETDGDPQIAVDSSGNINLAWSGNSSGSYDVFFSRSTDGGATFCSPQNLSNGSIGAFTPMPQIALDSFGNTYITWTNGDIFFTRSITVPTLPKLGLKPAI